MLSEEEYRRFVKPADIAVISAVADAPFNMLHVHGTGVYLEMFLDYPANTLNWPAHHSDYNVIQTSTLTDKCLVAGIDERGPITEGRMRATISQVTEAVNQAPRERFMVGSECTVPPETSPDVIRAIRDLVAQL
jgi:uroporphyrinogen decarboxylase